MNLLTVPVDRAATNVVMETQSAILSDSAVLNPVTVASARLQTAFSPTDFPWTGLLMSDLTYYYEGGGAEVTSGNVNTWVVQTVFTPPTESHFRNRILQARLPAKWILEGVQPPTAECRAQAFEVWKYLYTRFGLLPVRVSASVAGGITLCYEHATNSRTLIVEAYNDLEVAALVNQSKKIVYSENIRALDFDCAFLEFNV